MDQKLTNYIKQSQGEGKTKEDIYKELLNEGWKVDDIQAGFNQTGAESAKEDTHKRTILIMVIIGAILIGAGVFSLIASNWQDMPRTVKVLIIIIAMLAAYAAGWILKEKYQYSKTGGALFLLGTIIYGAGIFLVAQMFNIRANWPDGFILWMLGVMFMAFALDSFFLFYLAIPLGVIAIVGHPCNIFGFAGYDRFLLTSSFLLLITAIATFSSGLTIRKKMPEELKKFY